MAELTERQKGIYNAYLYALRVSQNKPFTPRKDFKTFKEESVIHLKKLENFFNKFPYIKVVDYFKAPFVIHKDEDFIGLDFFTKMSAVKTFSMYMKYIQEKDPDSEEQIKFIQDSLKFIGSFCLRNKLTPEKYSTHKKIGRAHV